MDDQFAKMDKRVDDLQRDITEMRREITGLLARSFRWIIVTVAVAVVTTWFGVYIILKTGAVRFLR